MPAQAREQPGTQRGSFLQARCDKVLVTNDWCLPLVLALLLLLLIYAFLYLPSLAYHNTTLWYIMDENLEDSCGCKHWTSQTADTPSPNRIIRLDCSFFGHCCWLVRLWQNYERYLVFEAISRKLHAKKKSGKDKENSSHSLQIHMFLEPKDIKNL